MLGIEEIIKRNSDNLLKLLPLLSLVVPFIALYFLDPLSFEITWKGRTYYFFFLWVFLLELILNWEKLQAKRTSRAKFGRTIVFVVTLLVPTAYVVVANFYGLNYISTRASLDLMLLSIEYLAFAGLFAVVIVLAYGIGGLKEMSMSLLFLGIIGVVFTIDSYYPYGYFTPFQIFVPTTAMFAERVLNLWGYQTQWLDKTAGTPVLKAWNSEGVARFGIAWPCSGIDSFLIYSVTILLFLKNTVAPWRERIIYFAVGAVVTYFINVLRIASIFVVDINGGDWGAFHNFYGPLYSITWIVSYPLIIIGSKVLWRKIRGWKDGEGNGSESLETISM